MTTAQQQRVTNYILDPTRLRAVIVTGVYASGTVGEAFMVKHGLGTRPRIVVALPLTDCRVWAEEADENSWDSERVYIRCSVASAPLRLLIVE